MKQASGLKKQFIVDLHTFDGYNISGSTSEMVAPKVYHLLFLWKLKNQPLKPGENQTETWWLNFYRVD